MATYPTNILELNRKMQRLVRNRAPNPNKIRHVPRQLEVAGGPNSQLSVYLFEHGILRLATRTKRSQLTSKRAMASGRNIWPSLHAECRLHFCGPSKCISIGARSMSARPSMTLRTWSKSFDYSSQLCVNCMRTSTTIHVHILHPFGQSAVGIRPTYTVSFGHFRWCCGPR